MIDKEWIGSILVRCALAGVLVWFAYHQIVGPDEWIGLVPPLMLEVLSQYVGSVTPHMVIMASGIVQVCAALLFILGRFVAIAGVISTLFFITLFAGHGFTHVGVRELALAIVSLSTMFRS